MRNITFITGNQNKADYLAKCLDTTIPHVKLDLDEIQSLSLRVVVEHKAKQAYDLLGGPVLVEDVSLEFTTLGRLPGAFIKWYIEELGLDRLCRMLDGNERSAIARGMFGYYDGDTLEFIEGELEGEIAELPRGSGGFGWDAIFIPRGQSKTRAEMDGVDDLKTYMTIKNITRLKEFLAEN